MEGSEPDDDHGLRQDFEPIVLFSIATRGHSAEFLLSFLFFFLSRFLGWNISRSRVHGIRDGSFPVNHRHFKRIPFQAFFFSFQKKGEREKTGERSTPPVLYASLFFFFFALFLGFSGVGWCREE